MNAIDPALRKRVDLDRLALLPLLALVAIGTLYNTIDATGALPRPTHFAPDPRAGFNWEILLVPTLLAFLVTPLLCLVLAFRRSRRRPLDWLVAPLSVAFLAAYLYSYEEGDGDYGRVIDHTSFPAASWIAGLTVGAVIAAVILRARPRPGLLCYALVTAACALSIVGIGLGGN